MATTEPVRSETEAVTTESAKPKPVRFVTGKAARMADGENSAPSKDNIPRDINNKEIISKEIIDQRFEHLLDTVRESRPTDDLDIIRRAWAYCVEQHAEQKRASGEPYVIHPLEVAQVLAEMRMDSTAIAAGLLHDAVEDTPVTTEDISRMFGEQVAHIVEGVTKLDKIQFANREDRQAENIRKMLLAMVSDVRVVLIKLADRLHNMRTLQHLKSERQQMIAQETIDIYAPLAHRLGMGKMRGELEDLAFRYVDPIAYEQASRELGEVRASGEKFLRGVAAEIEGLLNANNIQGRVEWRIKRLYSVHQKMTSQQLPLDQVFDLLAVRIITGSLGDCYAALGLVHGKWKYVPGRFKDFISMPRANMYQSLHTTVIAESGHQFEVQIRTEEMHRVAEEGIAAHWKYKADEEISGKDEQRLAWVRQLVEWQREMSDPNEFISTLKVDLYPEEVYAFTPKGKVVVLPKDASPIDFAYTVHSEVGNTCVGARVNGRMVQLRTKLRNGDIVEIITQKGHTPSRDWLSFTKSSRARNRIKHWLNEHQRERATETGRKLLEREARKYKAALSKVTDAEYERVSSEFGTSSAGDLLAGVGFGKLSARQVLHKLLPETAALSGADAAVEAGSEGAGGIGAGSIGAMSDAVKRVFFGRGSESLLVEGQDDLLVYRARCCNPIRGEEIVGYVTRGKGVAVHARNCPNVQNLLYESDRRIEVDWAKTPEADVAGVTKTYPVKLILHCDDRTGLLKELTAVISDDGTNIRSVDSKPDEENNGALVEFVVETRDVRHLTRLVTALRRIGGVRDVQRMHKI